MPVRALACIAIFFLAFKPQAVAAAQATFEDVSNLLGAAGTDPTSSWGATWADMDGDGWVDAFMNNHSKRIPYTLRNEGGLSFLDASTSSGLGIKTDNHSCKWCDFDRDGDLDVYCSTGKDHGTKIIPSRLMRNRGDGTFEDIAVATGTDFSTGRARTVSWIDIDADDDLDLFFGTQVQTTADPMSKLFRNDGAVFSDVTAAAGVNLDGLVRNSLPFDYDNDGDMDMLMSFQARDGVSTPCDVCLLILRNSSAGSFTVTDARTRGVSATWTRTMALGDYDNDGDLDLFQASDTPAAKLFRNNGNQTFTSVTLSTTGLGSAAAFKIADIQWADFDNDGYLDLFLVRTDVDSNANSPDALFLNNGNGTFRDATAQFNASGLATGYGDGAAVADFDRNGFLDLLVANGDGNITGTYQLLRNRGNENHWLRVLLTDDRGAVQFGAKLWLDAGGIQQYRESGNTSTAQTSNELIVHFGLGAQASADSLRVQWPDGSQTQLHGIAADQVIEIRKSGGTTTTLVPGVVGLLQAAAQSALIDAGLMIGTVSYASSDTVPADHVDSQNPPAGASVSLGSSISLVVSTGPVPTVVVPDVVGLSQDAAQSAITGAGLALGVVSHVPSDTVPANQVVSQAPAAGSSVESGTSVTLVVSTGPAPPTTMLPDVVGLTLDDAQAVLTDAGLAVGAVTSSASDTAPSGQVISQNPSAGAQVEFGTGIAVVVSSGPVPTTVVPDLVGLLKSAAEAALADAELAVGSVSSASSDTEPAGRVISQSPAAGSNVSPGSSVAFVVSTGPAPAIVVVPDLIGRVQVDAQTSLANAGLAVGTVSSASSDTMPAGRVIAQNPAAGTGVSPGSSVALVVSTGPGSSASFLKFDGINDVVSIKSSASLRISGAITVEARIRPRSLATNLNQDRIVRKGTNYELMASTNSGGCASGTSGVVQWSLFVGGQARRICGGTLALSQWHHVAGTYNGAKIVLYVDGVQVATVARTGPIALSNVVVTLGNVQALNRPYDGDMDDVAIWNRALSASEILSRATAALIGTESGLVGYWPMQEAAGQAVHDATSKANHGTLGPNSTVQTSDPIWTR